MKNKITCSLLAALVLTFSLLCIFLPKSDFSESERRVLAAFPDISTESVFSGDFSEKFEEYSTDTFPFRDIFRGIKAYSSEFIFKLSDNNKLFSQNGHLSKLEYPLNLPMLDHAAERFSSIFESYLKDSGASVYLSLVPDKNYFLDTLKLDYDKLTSYMQSKMPYAEYIDVFPTLTIDDYYTTDSHWRQECIGDTARAIADAMQAEISENYTENILDVPFYGVYAGQAAKRVAPDTIKYLTNDIISDCIVTSYDTGSAKPAAMYDMDKAHGRDPYEMFLSGNCSLLTIENPNAEKERELVVFRDSFAGSLVPLLCEGYSKITLVDIRYIQSSILQSFVDFDRADDVLFLYSTSLMNNSLALK